MRALLTITLLLFFTAHTQAQTDEKAKQILDKMSEKYKKMKSFRASFSWELVSKIEKISENFSGEITVKDNKYRLNLGDQEIYNNQQTVWTYLKDENEVTITEYEPDPEELTITKIYSIYKNGYKYIYMGEESADGKTYDVIDLTPEDRELSFFRIQIKVGKADSIIKSWKVFERNGRIYTYKIKGFKPEVAVNEQYFVFDTKKHPTAEIIDLRY